MNDLTFRPFHQADTDAVIALWRACGLTRPWNDPRADIARKLTVQPDLFVVAEHDGQIVGSAMGGYDGHRGNVYYLGVAPAHRGKGYGRAIMAHLEQRLTALGCPKFNILIRDDNHPVRQFYDAQGYAKDPVVCYGKRLIAD